VKVLLRIISVCLFVILFCGCAGKKGPSTDLVRRQLKELGLGSLQKKELQIRQVSMAQKNQAVLDTNFQLSLMVSREKGKDWQIESIRMGDRDWVDFPLFVEAFHSAMVKHTQEKLDKLASAINLYKAISNGLPVFNNITKLTDLLAPEFLSEIIRYDSWNHEIRVEPQTDGSLILRSLGADGILNTADDLIKRL
jgi:hypothetical protein